jgi:hypothetical protein
MTEDEAKTKWCPKIEHRGLGKCIGSGCMAWRWEPQTYEHHSNDVGSYVNTEPDTNRYGVRGKALPREGFCGLAGRP